MLRIGVIALASIMVLALLSTLALPWATRPEESPSHPPSTPAPLPSPTSPPPPAPAPPASEIPGDAIVLTQAQLQGRAAELTAMLNQSGLARVESLDILLVQDSMVLSAAGEFQGKTAQTDGLQVRFKDDVVIASGNVTALGRTLELAVEARVTYDSGTPQVAISRFQLGYLPLALFGLTKDKISAMINERVQSSGFTVPASFDGIRIQDGKLIILSR
ncbi:MAG: hypothetical protein HYX91_05295 [Chloroflexi bacterium]|nr:hypothetical protein [Chloroflexota bacterium]